MHIRFRAALLILLVALFAMAMLVGFAPSAPAAFINCPTFGTCWGTDEADDIDGTDGYDEIRGQDGADDIRGAGSGDDLYGGAGRDFLKGNGGDDFVKGNGGNDDINIASDDSGGDFADCGDGDNDEVWADPSDAVSPDCETVHVIF